MECDKYHPCQAAADMLTVKDKFGSFKGKKFVMSWAYSPSIEKPLSVPQSAIIAATKMGMDVVQVQPKGFELDPEVIKACEGMAKMNGSKFEISYDMDEAFKGAHVVYPKCWGSKDYFAKDEKGPDLKGMEKLFNQHKDWKCDEAKMKLADPNCIYMHCLPADRNWEVTNEVMDGPQSVVFEQAENRLHAQKAIMSLIMR